MAGTSSSARDATPDGGQYQSLDRARWGAEAAGDLPRQRGIAARGPPEGVLVLDETGFIKKGLHSAAVQRQYSGTVGRIDNRQSGGFLLYTASDHRGQP
ncbi:transposase [Halomonas kalidii]|uniref:transposase n=1 Tax=Halomonas kalidii TaxID=3043293 RepID=UPI00398CF2EB